MNGSPCGWGWFLFSRLAKAEPRIAVNDQWLLHTTLGDGDPIGEVFAPLGRHGDALDERTQLKLSMMDGTVSPG
jgi:hypothetical protein